MKFKKVLLGVLSTAFAASLALGLASCGEKKEPHTHSYAEFVMSPTCEKNGGTLHLCDCGDNYVDSETPAWGHEFVNYVSDNNATCTQDGTKTAACTRMGCEETDTLTDEDTKLGHNFEEYISDNNATC